MPTVFQDRAGISLYEAQFADSNSANHGERGPIPANVIDDVVARLARFKLTCEDFGVPRENIHVLATEASRTAPNAEEFLARIREKTGLEVRVVSKEEEGRIGALGVASGFASVEGLVMDLGGGSTQITWMRAKDGVVTTSPKGSVSFPYGAAALMRRLQEARKKSPKAEYDLKEEMKSNFRKAYEELEVPDDMVKAAEKQGGFDLYLSGGGFRGWGYLLMSESKVDPYPIPMINGFKASRADFHDTTAVMKTVSKSDTKDIKIFRVSKRRAAQVPAVAFLVNVLADALPIIKDIQFCQGGVREGFLFDQLPPEIRAQDPLLVATSPYAPPSAKAIGDLLRSALPDGPSSISSLKPPASFTPRLISALANLLYAHAPVHRESRPAAALYSTTTGLLASAHGLAHLDRALIALVLAERWPGDLTPAGEGFQRRLRQFVSADEAWWCQYLGRVATLIGDVYPAGVVPESSSPSSSSESGKEKEKNWRIRLRTSWQTVAKKKQKGTQDKLLLEVRVNSNSESTVTMAFARDSSLREDAERVEKAGKKKNWVKAEERVDAASEKAREDYGVKVGVEIVEGA